MAAGVFFVGCVAIVFAFAYWMKERDDSFAQEMRAKMSALNMSWQSWEKNAHLKFVSHDELTKVLLDTGDTWMQTYDLVCRDLAKLEKRTDKEVQAVQEHCVKLREGQYDLQNQISKKRPLIELPKGPFQFEIYTPTKNMGGKKPSKGKNK